MALPRAGESEVELKGDKTILIGDVYVKGAVDTKNLSWLQVKEAYARVGAVPPAGLVVLGDTDNHRYKLIGTFGNNPESDTYNAKGFGAHWVDLELAIYSLLMGSPLWVAGNAREFVEGADGKYYLLKGGGDPTQPVTSTDDWMDFAGIGEALAYLMEKTGDGSPVTVPLWKAEAYPKHHLVSVDGQWYRSKTATTASENPPSLPWEAINLGDFAQSPFATTAQAQEGTSTDTVMTPALTSSAISKQTKCALTAPAHGGLAWSENEYICENGVFYQAVGDDATASQVPPASPWEVVTVNEMFNQAPPYCALTIPAHGGLAWSENEYICENGVFYQAVGDDATASQVPPASPWRVVTVNEMLSQDPPYVEEPTVYPLSLTLSYTGSDVNHIIPANAKWLKVTANGAGLGGFSANRGAEGGKTTAIFDLQSSACIMQPGDTVKAMVGKRANSACSTNNSSNVSNAGVYGFGGAAYASSQCQSSGAGLSGLFTGTGSINAGSHSRAIIIGGGGGGYGSAPTGSGGYGNATTAGQSTMQGGSGGSGGGGGYRGGNAGHRAKGGTGFIHASAASGTKPVGGVSRSQNGSIKIEWITA